MATAKRKVLEQGSTVLNGRYQILKVLHTAGMSNVYLVEDSSLNKQWCLKEIVLAEAGKNEVEYRSLIRESNIMKSLNHSNIPRIVTIEEENGSKFIVMDYVDGLSVKDWLNRKGTVDQKTTVSWIKQVCSVLIYLHNRKNPIIYRDMKPDNIMIQTDGNIKLLDFGISEVITQNNKVIKEALGTKGFAAPEQRKKGAPYDLRSDIYALGKTMYYMLTGINPSIVAKGEKLLPIREVNPSISVGLEIIVNKCIEENPDNRYQLVEELLYDLQNYEKLDGVRIKKLKRKVWFTICLMLGSLFIGFCSLIPYILGKNSSESEYNYLVDAAYQSGREDDFVKAIEKKPEGLYPYIGYIESIKQDGVFDKREEETILNLLNPVLSKVKGKENYGRVSYEMGKMYWFYYDDTLDSCMNLSTKWFKDAIDCNYETEESTIYYNLGSFKKNIAMSIVEAKDYGMYSDYWNGLMQAKNFKNGEIVEIQVNLAIIDAINSYSYRLKSDGVSADELNAEITRIGKYLEESSPSEGKATELFEELQNSYNSISDSTRRELSK